MGRPISFWKIYGSASMFAMVAVLILFQLFTSAETTTHYLSLYNLPQADEATPRKEVPPLLLQEPENQTVVVGEAALLRCRAADSWPAGPNRPRVLWHARRTGRVHPESRVGGGVMTISAAGLSWSAVNKTDEDWYRCSVRTPAAMAHSQWAYLRVLARTRISDYPGGYSVNHGTRLSLQCVAHGDPLPHITWTSDGDTITDGIEDTGFQGYVRSVLTVTATQTANYTCRATNSVRGQQHTDTRTSTLSVLPKITQVSRPSGYCARYEGAVCREQVGGAGLVWYNSTPTDTGGWHNERITQQLWAEMIDNFQQPCRAAAEQLLCRYSFPECKLLEGYQLGLPLCREDCIATQLLFCVNEWLLILETNKDQQAIKGREHFRLPVCEDLPSYGDGSQHTCSHVGLTTLRQDLVTHSCMRSNGRWYLGTINVTVSGIPCQRWDVQEPHSHNRPPQVFPEIQGAENYCRNAGGEEPRPWCYTTDPMVRWQHCHVPLCEEGSPEGAGRSSVGNIVSGVGGGATLSAGGTVDGGDGLLSSLLGGGAAGEKMVVVWVVGAGAVLVLGLLMVVVCLVVLVKIVRRQPQVITVQPDQADQQGGGVAGSVVSVGLVPDNDAYHETAALLHPKLHPLQYDRNNIVFVRDLGQGAFGRVFQGRATKLVPGEDETTVAVKVLKEDAGADMAGDFEREACTLASFQHPNIVRLLGVCAVGKPMCLLFEYMGKGDLNTFLRSCSPSGYVVPCVSGRGFSDTSLSQQDMLHIGQQLASGMVFLSSRKFVHRDLATRNCLIADDMTVKIADFGLSQRLYMADYYRGGERDAIPIRWMPLESILYSRYTVESDVWAFGVVLWEIFSLALQPYYGLSHEEVVSLLQEGGQLSQSAHCPSDVYTLMTWCWQRRPQDRPVFSSIFQALVDLRAGRVANLPSLPTPAPYNPAGHLSSPHHHPHHDPHPGGGVVSGHHAIYTPYEAHTLPHSHAPGSVTHTACSHLGTATTLAHFHNTNSVTHTCLANMRAGSRGSFCSTDLLPSSAAPTRPCSCVPPQHQQQPSHVFPASHHQHHLHSSHTGPSVGSGGCHSGSASCHTLPRNTGSQHHGGSPKHSGHRPHLSHAPDLLPAHGPPQTLPRANGQQQLPLSYLQLSHQSENDQTSCSVARKDEELREVPEEHQTDASQHGSTASPHSSPPYIPSGSSSDGTSATQGNSLSSPTGQPPQDSTKQASTERCSSTGSRSPVTEIASPQSVTAGPNAQVQT